VRVRLLVLLHLLVDVAEDSDGDGALAQLWDREVGFREEAVADFSNDGFDFKFRSLERSISVGSSKRRRRGDGP
jgi:hypothetical protein